MRYFWLIILSTCGFIHVSAQSNAESIIEQHIESILESIENESDENEVFDQLVELSNYPINLNCKSFEILKSLKLINSFQYYQLLNHVNSVGSMISLQELKFIEGFSNNDISKLQHFVFVDECSISKIRLFKPKVEITNSYNKVLEKQTGYINTDNENFMTSPNKYYLGKAYKLQSRIKVKSGDVIKAGFILEKDAGEILFKNQYKDESKELLNKSSTLSDYSSCFLELNGLIKPLKIIVGDYQLQFGQGLIMWSNMAFGKSVEATAIKKYARGINPNTSSNENHYFRGVSTSLQLKNLEINLFGSSKKRDGNLISDSTFSSFQNTGLHRTVNELNDKNTINESILGGNLSLAFNRIRLGFTAYNQSLNKTLIIDDQLYKKYNFGGKENHIYGFDYQINLNKIELFGEIAQSKNKALALISGLTYYAGSQSIIHFHYRNYSKDFKNFYSNAISENSEVKNEEAVYFGFKSEIHPKWKVFAYTDWFKFPWIKSGVSGPSNGNQQLVQLNYLHSKKVNIYARYKRQLKQKNQIENDVWNDYLITELKESYRLHLSYTISTLLNFQSRAEWSVIKTADIKSNGLLMYQEMNFTSVNNKLKSSFRYTFFNTDDYDTRIYTYEKDIRYSFSIPSFYGRGSRFYLLITYKPNNNLTARFKLSQTKYHDRDSIGSGLDLIDGNKKTEIKVQLQIKI